jgi:uncharacterized protein YuzE
MLALGGCSKVDEVKDLIDPASKFDVDYGMTVIDADEPNQTIGIVVTNNSDKVATDVVLKITPYDAEGEMMNSNEAAEGDYSPAIQDAVISYIYPGEKSATVYDNFYNLDKAPDHVEVEVKSVEWKDSSELPEGDVTITDFSYTPGSDVAYVSVKNTTGFTYDINDLLQQYWVNVNVIGYDEEGKIVGGDFGSVQYLGPDSETSEEMYLDGKLSKTDAVTFEPYVNRIDFQPDPGAIYYDKNGKEYTAEEVEEYYRNKNQ